MALLGGLLPALTAGRIQATAATVVAPAGASPAGAPPARASVAEGSGMVRVLARRLQWVGQLSVGGYRFKEKQVRGTATPLTSGVGRIPTQGGTGSCDKAGRYRLVVERRAAKGPDAGWPMELMFHVEHQLKQGVTPARSEPEYGADGTDAALPDGAPVHCNGDFSPAVTGGAKTFEIAPHPRIGVLVRIAVPGKEKSGPQAGAPAGRTEVSPGDSPASADGTRDGGGGWPTGRVVAVAIGSVCVLLPAGLAAAYGRTRRKPRAGAGNSDPMRGGSW
ncbi:hypothetical protein [Streptomyces sp. NPDC015125]|uniref:hypothetical protein n=1 Tax=Streptomyces sp. NPDC015125 TaxID=3364938 RepID=UPI0036FAEE78